MILEGLVTTTNDDGSPRLAPMGPRFTADLSSFVLRPFPTSRSYQNLLRHPMGVFHTTDDVLLLAHAAVGAATMPAHEPAKQVNGFQLSDYCRCWEFQVQNIDTSQERVTVHVAVLHQEERRAMIGLNRAKNAVVEAAILCTRLHLISPSEIATEFQRLRVIVDKTAGEKEREAMQFLEEFVQNQHTQGDQ